ncbi:MgtC/SapB family protein [Roseibium limicola]|uniref:Protein MgtC n=1 Tax=Roseibium limicola TaxID=2816037 RepID=A0A939EM29_9HYPH|nr:MgtC/SapB family protein [Roseibium limicola]MBO0345074.1 MgtC/SapB family protein [Roseibium limicola]
MNELLDELTTSTYLPLAVILARMAAAVALGALLGFERELNEHAAGLRTHVLISLSAATVAILTIEFLHFGSFKQETVRMDPIRMVEAVTSGVAFLAAGMIVFTKGEVKGLTTGAGMWLAGASGLAVGLGLWSVAIPAALLGFLVIAVLRWVEHRVVSRSKSELEQDRNS